MSLSSGDEVISLTSVKPSSDKSDEQLKESLMFSEHGASIFAISLHPNLPLVASGGEGENVLIWDYINGDVFKTINDIHTESVSILSFSRCGSYLASVDMNGLVSVYNFPLDKILSNRMIFSDEVNFLRWSREDRFLAGGQDCSAKVTLFNCEILAEHFHSLPVIGGEIFSEMIITFDENELFLWGDSLPLLKFRVNISCFDFIANSILIAGDHGMFLFDMLVTNVPHRVSLPFLVEDVACSTTFSAAVSLNGSISVFNKSLDLLWTKLLDDCFTLVRCHPILPIFIVCGEQHVYIFEFESSHEISKILMRQQPLALVLNRDYLIVGLSGRRKSVV
eukprot:TRINITY_DN147_c0_g1_i1.p1 TRINITY_DN147_c0_g1~~TRINITY_DN147_c0_g1_i1.p1  ORF type:complete len:336 (+),score=18.70 TRINITY_DN147_c0_g1_i1:386-1393(+)